MAPNVIKTALSVFFEYDTPRIVHIKSKKVGVINRLLQLLIIGYIVGYAIVYKKGYQEFEIVQSAVTTKVKGIALVNDTASPEQTTIWDIADYVVPPQENNAFFVVTNFIKTPDQKQDTCPEDVGVKEAACTSDADCTKPLPTGNGIPNGTCSIETKTCFVRAWCPVEHGSAPKPPLLLQSKDFTVFIKNNVDFPKFNIKRQNLPLHAKPDYLTSCNYNSQNKDCPIFKLGTIVEGASNSQDKYASVAVQGAVMQIIINWDCNFDYSQENCVPKYDFRRLDSSAESTTSPGLNFRYARYYKDPNGTEIRTLYKAYGIKYIITVNGRGGKFAIVPLLLNFGSGIALLSVATVICDIVVLYVLKARVVYREKKYLEVVGDDAYSIMDEPKIE